MNSRKPSHDSLRLFRLFRTGSAPGDSVCFPMRWSTSCAALDYVIWGILPLDAEHPAAEGDGGIQAQDHGHIPHTAHGDLVQKQHGLDAAQQSIRQTCFPVAAADTVEENKPVHDKVPDFRRDEQLQQIVAVKPLHVVGSLHALVQQQRSGDHEKQRHTQMAEYRYHALQQR